MRIRELIIGFTNMDIISNFDKSSFSGAVKLRWMVEMKKTKRKEETGIDIVLRKPTVKRIL